ncbi:MAG: alpha/beta hydrolase [Archangium sp.]|nr:alpha/beta hydrolase [Archangium sp.]
MNVLFVHSTGTGPFMWDTIPEDVVAAERRLTPPNLGYPPLEDLPRGKSITVNDDVKHLLAGLPASGAFHLVGHSYGGLIAIKAAQQLGARVKSMFLIEPVMFGAIARDGDADPDGKKQLDEFLKNRWFLDDERRGGTEEWLEIFIDYWNRPGSWQRLPELMRHHNLSMGWKMFNEVRSVFRDSGSYEDNALPQNVPVTLVVGERSPLGSREVIRALSKRNPQARVVTLHGTGHMAPLTHPAKVAEALAAHLR